MRLFKSIKQKLAVTFSVLGSVAVLAFFFFSSYADVIWEPRNSFYESHKDSIVNYDRMFIANSPDEEGLKVYKSPETGSVIETYDNGTEIYIAYKYTDKAGNEWGLVSNCEGWVPMDYLATVYDEIAFREEHAGEIRNESAELKIKTVKDGKAVYFYEYPGSESFFDPGVDDDLYFNELFTDEAGHTWGYVSYFRLSSGWVCIDNPGATYEELYPNGQNFSGKMPEPTKPTIIVEPGKKINIGLVVGICVGVIAMATAVILIVLLNKGKKKR